MMGSGDSSDTFIFDMFDMTWLRGTPAQRRLFNGVNTSSDHLLLRIAQLFAMADCVHHVHACIVRTALTDGVLLE